MSIPCSSLLLTEIPKVYLRNDIDSRYHTFYSSKLLVSALVATRTLSSQPVMLDKYGPVLWTCLALLAVYGIQTLRRWRYIRLEQFADFPQLGKPSIVWGHMALLGKLLKKGDSRRHIGKPRLLWSPYCETSLADQLTDQVLLEVAREQGNPPVILLDLRPVEYPMLVICSYEVAEQITKASPRYSSSLPKSPTLRALWHLTGKNSILTEEVSHGVHFIVFYYSLGLTGHRENSGNYSVSD